MKLTQLSTSEFKFDSAEDFCLNSSGNCMVLSGNSNDVTILELMNGCDTMILMPYNSKQITVSQNKPISDLFRNVDFVKIYETSTVQESQELALDLIYTADCATEPVKARVLQANIVTENNRNICCILTNYGYCEIFKKVAIIEEWKPLNTNLSNVLTHEVFPLKVNPQNIKTFNDFKTLVNKFIITSFVMSTLSSELIIYLGTAAGYIVAVKYNDQTCKFEQYCHLKTSLNRINYIIIYKNLLLVGCNEGKVLLIKINFENRTLQELEYLWSKPDRMACRKASFNYNEDLRSYLVVFCKAAHLVAYRLDVEGAVVSSSTLYVSGIRITGIESITENEFIITTMIAEIKYIKVVCPTKDELHIEEQTIDHELDSTNYQILGVAASASKNLWSLLLYRNKDYVHQSKYSATSAFLNVYKLNTRDSFVKLINMNLRSMNMVQDLILAINLDIFNHMELDKYMDFLNLEKLTFPDEINDAFQQKFQIKMIITRKLASYQNIKYKKLKTHTKNELQVLEPALQMLHIIRRLRYLNKFSAKEIKLSKFRELSIVCMHLQFIHLLNDVIAINNNVEEENFRKAVDKFVKFLTNEFEKYKLDTSNFANPIENCMICQRTIKNFTKCEQEHEIKRCTISCTQLTLFKSKHCPHCYALARNDNEAKLQELYATDEDITCLYCRFLLKQEEF